MLYIFHVISKLNKKFINRIKGGGGCVTFWKPSMELGQNMNYSTEL